MIRSIFAFLCLSVSLWSSASSKPGVEVVDLLRRTAHEIRQLHPHLGSLSPQQIVDLAYEWEQKAAHELGVPLRSVRRIDLEAFSTLIAKLEQNQGGLIILRHGGQEKTFRAKALKSSALQKIEMMRAWDNENNPLEKTTAAEFVGMMMICRYLQEISFLEFQLQSSGNRRAVDAMEGLGAILDREVVYCDAWNCVNYPPRDQLSDEELLTLLPNGSLPWNVDLVDKVIGEGSYQQITEDVVSALNCIKPGIITIVMSHTQQTNAACLELGLPVVRLGYFGFILAPAKQDSPLLLKSGLYTK